MIQRVQSIWLLLASLTMFLLLLLPVVTFPADTPVTPAPSVLLYGALASGLVCFVAIFCYNNRSMQKKIILLAIILIIGLCAGTYFTLQQSAGGLTGAKPSIGAFLPMMSVIFCLLAYRGIRNDEHLLRSADRLR